MTDKLTTQLKHAASKTPSLLGNQVSPTSGPRHADRTSASRTLVLAASLIACAGAALALASANARAGADDPAPTTPPTTPSAPSALTPARAPAPAKDPAAANGTPAEDPAAPTAPQITAAPTTPDTNGRRAAPEGMTIVSFKNVTVDQVIPFIVETTGKMVFPPPPDVLSRRISVLNDRPIPKREALDFVITALIEQGVAVVETDKLVRIRDITEIDRMGAPVVGPEQRIAQRTDFGAIVQKVFVLKHGQVSALSESLKAELPQWSKFFVEAESNQIIVTSNIATLQRIEALIDNIDRPSAASLFTETFFLRSADAEQVAKNITDLYAANQNANANRNAQANPFAQLFRPGGQGGGQGGGAGQAGGSGASRGTTRSGTGDAGSTSANLRVTANAQQNSVTVFAERTILDQVKQQITEAWDRPVTQDTVVPKIYALKNSDPVKVKDLLAATFGNPGSSSSAGGGGGAQSSSSSTAGQTANRLYGQFTFEAIAESAQLLVVAKNSSHLSVIDEIIERIDKPQSAGLPQIVELKHAQAEELAEQLNALLAQEGTLAAITKSESGLTTSATSSSPFATSNQNSTTGTANTNTQNTNQQQTAGTIQFWWQRGRVPTNSAGASNLVSKIRIVPVWRRNSLMVLAPPEYHASLVSVIEALDRPGRQVLLSAVIAEISINDTDNLGVRWSSQTLNPANADNSFGLGPTTGQQSFTGQKTDLLPGLFTSSTLNVGANINLLLQALSQKTAVNILSEPRIFTSDNQQAEFFSGQDIPFITNSQTSTTNNNLVQSFDYRAVGIALRVRPRITVNKDVDLRINLELSSIQPNQTLFGGFIVDRRETTTQLIVQNGQTVVVSGIIRTQDQDTKRKVPLLGDIPIVGAIFNSTEKTQSKTELIAFVTPYVINNTSEADDINQGPRERLGEIREELRPAEELGGKKPIGELTPKPASSNPAQDPADPSKPAIPAPTPTPPRPASRPRSGMFE